MKSFAAGDSVHIARIGTGIVREVRSRDRYLVDIKGRSMVVTGDQLQTVDSAKGRADSVRSHLDDADARLVARTPPSLDLHGRTVLESLEALDAFVNDAILDGHAEARVIHGRSGGRVRAAVRKRLAELPSVRSFRIDPRNPGVTIILF